MKLAVISANLGYLMLGLWKSLGLSLVAIAGSLLFGTLIGIARLARAPVVRQAAGLYVDVMRGTPLIMVIFWVFFFLPVITRMPLNPTTSGIVALVAFYASHVAEIVRAGVQGIPKGQTEAGMASGLSYATTMRFIVLPQAVRNMIPAFVTRFVALFMGTSLLYVIGVVDFFGAATIVVSREDRPIEIYSFVATTYFVLCYGLSRFGDWCEKKLRVAHIPTEVGW